MAGRPKEPIDVLIAKGKSHLTKGEIEKRRSEEIQVESKDIVVPAYLTDKKDIKRFEYFAELLSKVGIFTELDNDCLARYILAEKDYLRFTKALDDEFNGEGDSYKLGKIQNQQDKAFKMCQACARDLGLTIGSRAKLVVPQVASDEDDEL